jgi:hypothetical protein
VDEATVAESGETAERLHRMLSAALEAGYADRARVMLGRSGDDLPLTRVLAGRVALVGGDAATALAEADAVLARGDDLPRPPCEGIAGTADIDTRLAALDIRARALDFLGDRVAAGQAWAAQAKQAVAAGRTQAELRAVFHLGKQEFFDGRGLDRLREAVELARRAGALIELAWAEETLAIALILQGDPAAALEVLDAAIPRAQELGFLLAARAGCLSTYLFGRTVLAYDLVMSQEIFGYAVAGYTVRAGSKRRSRWRSMASGAYDDDPEQAGDSKPEKEHGHARQDVGSLSDTQPAEVRSRAE